jgi:hypothetical protein
MKPFRIVQLLAFVATCFCVQAQDTLRVTNKKGVPLLPKAGDKGFVISTHPFFSYLGSMFSENGAVPPEVIGLGFHYLKTDRLALIFDIDTRLTSSYNENELDDDRDSGLRTVTDEINSRSSSISMSFGFEKRRNRSRLVTFWGVRVGASVRSSIDQYNYGNVMSTQNQTPQSTIWFNTFQRIETNLGQRRIEERERSFSASALANFGLEYFFAPRVAARLELTALLSYQPLSTIKTKDERFNFQQNIVERVALQDTYVPRELLFSANPRSFLSIAFYF